MIEEATARHQPNVEARLFACVSILFLTALLWAYWDDSDPLSLFWTNRDFANYWVASKLALNGQALDLFNGQDNYIAQMQKVFGDDYPWHNWSYPPHYVLLMLPLGGLPYLPSGFAFQLATFALFLHAARVARTQDARNYWVLLLPFIVCNVQLAQNGFLTAALMLYGLSLRLHRPLLAGIAMGFLTVKPQLGLLLPILLVLERQWQTIAFAAATAVGLIALSAVTFGIEAWIGYIDHNLPYQTIVMTQFGGYFLHLMPSVYGTLRSLDFEPGAAMAIHAPVACAALAIFVYGSLRLKNPKTRALNFLFATFCFTPYSLVYDLGALCAVAAIERTRVRSSGSSAIASQFVSLALALVCLLPIVAAPMSLAGFPIGPLVLSLGWAAVLAHYWRKPHSTLPAGSTLPAR